MKAERRKHIEKEIAADNFSFPLGTSSLTSKERGQGQKLSKRKIKR